MDDRTRPSWYGSNWYQSELVRWYQIFARYYFVQSVVRCLLKQFLVRNVGTKLGPWSEIRKWTVQKKKTVRSEEINLDGLKRSK